MPGPWQRQMLSPCFAHSSSAGSEETVERQLVHRHDPTTGAEPGERTSALTKDLEKGEVKGSGGGEVVLSLKREKAP